MAMIIGWLAQEQTDLQKRIAALEARGQPGVRKAMSLAAADEPGSSEPLGTPEMRQQSRIPPDLRRPLNVHRIEDLATSYRDGKRSLGVIVYNIVLVSVLATAFFLWNHLQNAFGPMGYGLDLAANARF